MLHRRMVFQVGKWEKMKPEEFGGSPEEYLHLIYLFYRHPAKAFEIVNSGRTVHGILFFAVFIFIVHFFYCIWGYYFSGIFNYDLSPLSIITATLHGIRSSLSTTTENLLVSGIVAIILLFLLRLIYDRIPVIQALSTIFYSCAIAYPFTLLVYVINAPSGLFLILKFIYLLPLAYLEYTGLKDLLKTKTRLILIAVATVAFIDIVIWFYYYTISGNIILEFYRGIIP